MMTDHEKVKNIIDKTSDIRQDKIEEVKLKIKDGYYEKNKEKIIEELVNKFTKNY